MEDDCEYISKNLKDLKDDPQVFITACEMGSKKCIKFLIQEYNALKDKSLCFRALLATIQKNNFILTKYLFENGAIIDNENGSILMFRACIENNNDIVKLLLDNIILPDEKCFKILIAQGCNDLFKFLFKHSNVKPVDCIYYSYFLHEYDILFFLHDQGITYDSPTVSYHENFKKNIDEKIYVYDKIIDKTRNKAARKIYFWWIPICYDLNRQSGKNMMNKILNRIENYEKPIL